MTTFSGEDRTHMARALEIARRGLYSTAPNPAVGCVLVRDGAIVAEGFHERAGEPHAEVMALRAAGASARGAAAFITLEPCAHHGRTPPCTNALLEAGVSRVVCAMLDANPRVDGGGLELLRRAGVDTACGLLEAEARELNRGFVARMERGKPWLTIKLGASADGRTALANGQSRWITSEASRADVQTLRARASAIVTGSGTVLADDPRLTVRDASLDMRGRRPLRVVLDSGLRTPHEARVYSDASPTLVFTVDADTGAARALRDRGVTVEPVPCDGAMLDLDAVLARLAGLECNEVLVEAGPRLAGALVRVGYADELVLYVAPVLLGHDAKPLLELPLLRSMTERVELVWHDIRPIGPDLRLTLRPRRSATEEA